FVTSGRRVLADKACWSDPLRGYERFPVPARRTRKNIMKKWEYRIIDTNEGPGGGIFKGKSRPAIEAYLNELGAQGWEIVNFDALEWKGCMAFRGVAKRERQ